MFAQSSHATRGTRAERDILALVGAVAQSVPRAELGDEELELLCSWRWKIAFFGVVGYHFMLLRAEYGDDVGSQMERCPLCLDGEAILPCGAQSKDLVPADLSC